MHLTRTPRIRGIFAALLTGALGAFLATAQAASLYKKLESRGYETLVTAIDKAGLKDALSDESASYTIFAPSERAFSKIPGDVLEALLEDPEGTLKDILLYHVVDDEISYRDFEDGQLPTLLPEKSVSIDVQRYGWWWRTVRVNESRITRANIRADNGIIHEIDHVLDPSFMESQSILEIAASMPEKFSTLAELAEIAGLTSVLDSDRVELTLFAPTNEAFALLPPDLVAGLKADPRTLRKVLLYHLVHGEFFSSDLETGEVRTLARQNVEVTVTKDEGGDLISVMVNDSDVIQADVDASNGVIHVINAVLVPEIPKSLTTVISENDDLNKLEAALVAAGLADTFDSTHPYPKYTIFAPMDSAFPDGEELIALLENPALADILKLHVVPGQYLAAQLRNGQALRTLAGAKIKISIDEDGGVSVNNAAVVEPNLKAANGVVHIIDAVIGVEPYTIADFVAEKRYLTTLNAALGATGLDAVLAGEGPFTLFAPTDGAFGKLPEGNVEALLGATDDLANILLYHVLAGAQSKEELVEAGSAATVQGSEVTITTKTIRIWWWRYTLTKVNDAVMISTDRKTDNGIVHIINGVLLPPAAEDGGDGEDS